MNATADTVADEKVLEVVRHLIAKIDHPNTPDAEREFCRERADRLMMRYAIDRARLEETMTADQRETPTKIIIDLGPNYAEGANVAAWCAEHLADSNRCRTMRREQRQVEASTRIARHHIMLDVYGFAADTSFVEMMWTSIALAFASTVHPRWEEQLSEGENIRRLKTAGFKWEDVARMGGFDWPDGGKMKRIYLRHLREIGRENERVSTQRHDAYRAAFISAFYDRLSSRISQIAADHAAQIKDYEAETGTSGTALVLADRKAVVDEAFYQEHPYMRPATPEERAQAKARRAAERAEREAREAAEWEALSPKERLRQERAQARAQARAQRASDKYWDEHYRRTTDSAGASAGRAAADKVNLSRTTGVSGTTRKEIN